jgi:hypothetical protein
VQAPPDPHVRDFAGIQRNFDWLRTNFPSGAGAPSASLRAPIGAIYTDRVTGAPYVMRATGWHSITTTAL